MELLQNIDGGTLALLAVGLCVLCLVLPILLSGLSILGSIIGLIADLAGTLIGLVSSGPSGWCGCLVVLGGCGFLVLAVALIGAGLSGCDANPTNLCVLFGR